MITKGFIKEVNDKTNIIRDSIIEKLKIYLPKKYPEINFDDEYWSDLETSDFSFCSDMQNDLKNGDWFCYLVLLFHDSILVKYGIFDDEYMKENSGLDMFQIY